MSRFFRNESPPNFEDYAEYRPFLRRDFHFVCAYCERSESALGGEEFFEIDHFRPVKKFPEQTAHYPNLYYACGKCNRHKGSTWPSEGFIAQGLRFADPCEEDLYATHLEEAPDGTLRARTSTGDYTCKHIRLNRPDLLDWRRKKRQRASELQQLQAIIEGMELLLNTMPRSDSQDELRQRLAALEAKFALLASDTFCSSR